MVDDEVAFSSVGYVERAATAAMHALPRFGHTHNFAAIFTDKDEAGDYIGGLLFAGVFLLAFFFTWSLVLLIFKCLGPSRVGFLSGSPFMKSSDVDDNRRSFLTRVVFLNAAILLIIFSVLLVTQGLTNFKSTFTTVIDTSNNVNAITSQLDAIIKHIEETAQNSSQASRELTLRLNSGAEICLVNTDSSNSTDPADRDFETIISGLRNTLNGFVFQPEETQEFLNATEFVMDTSNDVNESSESLEIDDWQSLVVIIPFVMLSVILTVGVIVAWFEFYIPWLVCLLNWLFLPLFVIMIVFSYVVSSLTIVAASANSDFCSGGQSNTPDETVRDLIFAAGYTEDDLTFRILSYYVGQCVAQDPFAFLVEYEDDVLALTKSMAEFTQKLEDTATDALSEACAREVVLVQDLSVAIHQFLISLAGGAKDAVLLLQCNNIVQLYTDPVYAGTCTYSISGVTWAFSSFAVVGVMGLIMITLRSSWHVDVVDAATLNKGAVDKASEESSDISIDAGISNRFKHAKDIGDLPSPRA